MSLLEYILLALTSLFVVVDPVGIMPSFVAMTARDSVETRIRMARLACWVTAGVLILFMLTGQWIFKLLGITLPAFQIAGSLLLLRIALDMLHGQRSAAHETNEETEAGMAKEDIAITPLAVPMLAGPGSISTALILLNQAHGWEKQVALYGCIAAVCLISYWIFRFSAVGAKRINPIALKVVTRLMGLLLAAVAVQFSINAIIQLGWVPGPKS